MAEENKLSPVERIKQSSDGLRGTIKDGLLGELSGAIADSDQNLVKFHGMYQQDDRDRREERAQKKLERLYSFMIRLRLPGWKESPAQPRPGLQEECRAHLRAGIPRRRLQFQCGAFVSGDRGRSG